MAKAQRKAATTSQLPAVTVSPAERLASALHTLARNGPGAADALDGLVDARNRAMACLLASPAVLEAVGQGRAMTPTYARELAWIDPDGSIEPETRTGQLYVVNFLREQMDHAIGAVRDGGALDIERASGGRWTPTLLLADVAGARRELDRWVRGIEHDERELPRLSVVFRSKADGWRLLADVLGAGLPDRPDWRIMRIAEVESELGISQLGQKMKQRGVERRGTQRPYSVDLQDLLPAFPEKRREILRLIAKQESLASTRV